ncbi:MAG: hypothetical protein WDN69_17355 [Aliidongia sp.]
MARYIAEQVTAPLAPALQDFLHDVVLLPAIDAETADALRQTRDSRALLGRLADLAPLFEAGRLHPLLAQYLLNRLQNEPERRQHLCRNASAHFAGAGDIVAAVRYALMGGEGAAVARRVIEAGGLRLYLVHGVGSLRKVAALLPAATVAAVPRLRLIEALLMMNDGHVEDGWRLFRQIVRETAAETDPVEQAEFDLPDRGADRGRGHSRLRRPDRLSLGAGLSRKGAETVGLAQYPGGAPSMTSWSACT